MTSETETLKTNEFLRRRKLRLQQVREQSKDIAKKIRQRAKVESLRQADNLDAKKQKEYFDRQEKLVKRLEVLYARGLNNVGASHKSASEVSQDEEPKSDLSKLRGKEAAAELRKKRQLKLDEQKKILDRKLQAREAANELSREKSSVVSSKLLPKTPKCSENTSQLTVGSTEVIRESPKPDNIPVSSDAVTMNDMATQWDTEPLINEWEPAVPVLSIPKDDQGSSKVEEPIESKSAKSKRMDLFAVSQEMPSDLRSKHIDVPVVRDTDRPSLTMISEYLQNRNLRLRETEAGHTNRRSGNDMPSLKQTIQRTRNLKVEGRSYNACQVLDEQLVPVPSWHAEKSCSFCTHKATPQSSINMKEFSNVTCSQINKIFGSVRQGSRLSKPNVMPRPVLRSTSPFRRHKTIQGISKVQTGNAKVDKHAENVSNTKGPVLMYNHNTRDVRDIPSNEHVVRDEQPEEDAYSQAMKEVSIHQAKNKEHQQKVQEFRHKVAVNKQTVEKEYKDTIHFLNSLPKDKPSRVVKTVFMDDERQQTQKNNRQFKMQEEFKKVERECKRRQHTCSKRRTSNSPTKSDDNDFDRRDFQYSWMPVPEGDGNLAVHAIPNSLKGDKSGNTVKFSQVDSYHEYRSRHKHTPPTKDTTNKEKQSNNREESVVFDEQDGSGLSDDVDATDSSSLDNLALSREKQDANGDQNSSDAERIIIYKILDSKNKQTKKHNKLLSDIAKSMTSVGTGDKNGEPVRKHCKKKKVSKKPVENSVSFEQVNEGIYKVAKEKGDNVTAMYVTNECRESHKIVTFAEQLEIEGSACTCGKSLPDEQMKEKGTVPRWEDGVLRRPKIKSKSACKCSLLFQNGDASQTAENQGSSNTKPACNCSLTFQKGDSTPLTEKHVGSKSQSMCKCSLVFRNEDAAPIAGSQVTSKLTPECNCSVALRNEDATETLENDVCCKQKPVCNCSTVSQSKEATSAENQDIAPTTAEPPTASTSTSSFKTATNDRATHSGSAEGGYIKVLDETGQEAGKFFLGANGFLKDDGYEVIIQVRKRDDPNEEKTDSKSLEQTNKNKVTNKKILESKGAGDKNVTKDSDTNEVMSYRSYASKESINMLPHVTNEESINKISNQEAKNKNTPFNAMINKNTQSDENVDEFELLKSEEDDRELSDKCTNARSENLPIPHDTYSRPATSTYTQTTNSPIHLSLYKHRNSSTSTAYMSPPETILPVLFESCPNNKTKRFRDRVNVDYNLPTTPPNSATSNASMDQDLARSKVHKTCKFSRRDQYKCKHKRENIQKPCRKNRRGTSENRQTHMTYFNRHIISRNRLPNTDSKRDTDANLNPIIKKYINRLLALSRDGIKAIEVADQECSSVGTPGSSIINDPYNIDKSKSSITNKISLEQMKKILMKQIVGEHSNYKLINTNNLMYNTVNKPCVPRKLRRKQVHKVKSLNISKHLLKNQTTTPAEISDTSYMTSTDDNNKSSLFSTGSQLSSSFSHKLVKSFKSDSRKKSNKIDTHHKAAKDVNTPKKEKILNKGIQSTSCKVDSVMRDKLLKLDTKKSHSNYKKEADIVNCMSTQTNQNIESEFIKLAEDKLQNMEKIADLTEKCTIRLSNLAKVLEEVRKNKSLAYSQISASDSADSPSEHKSEQVLETPVSAEAGDVENQINKSPELNLELKSPKIGEKESTNLEYISILDDIPKLPVFQPATHIQSSTASSNLEDLVNSKSMLTSQSENTDTNSIELTKYRPKPPPALSRIHLKHVQDNLTPHELSTVMEVDSPLSVKNKYQSSRNDAPSNSNRSSNEDKECGVKKIPNKQESIANPDLVQTNLDYLKQTKLPSTESSDDSKFQMIDLKQFNDIMLEPFLSIHEYAKKYNVETPEEESHMEDLHREEAVNDDISSLHSDGSLPDVIAELLKRNIITEPFKFDTGSNVNSLSSESTLSMLALSKARKIKKRAGVMFHNKENIGETSDTLSISSNPDLENAFKKLGMGWASSTLKKTKERLALSSSSNTSSSSIPHFKIKSFHQDIPVLVTDSVSSALLSQREKGKDSIDTSKNAEQQTSFANQMTVKEFLAKELAKKITFTNKSINDTEEEFVSLYETRIPETMKQRTNVTRNNQSNDSMHSGVNRARTSTPVQIYKSMTYHSSSNSNISNGFFSNVEDISSVKITSNSMKNHSTSEKDDLTIPNFSLKMKKTSDCSKSD